MDTRDILTKRISLCLNIHAKSYKTITLFDALNAIRTEVYKNQIENIRELYSNGNIASYHAKKKQLPAYIFSGILFDSRHKFDISGYTSLLIVDIDKIDEVETIKSQLQSDPYVVCIWKSPSGNGLKALFCLEYTDSIDPENIWIVHEYCAFPQVSNYLAEKYDIHIDKTGGDITRMCFVSSDFQIHLKREFEPFLVMPNLNKKQIWKIKTKYYYGRQDVRKAIIEMKQIAKQITIGTTPTVTSIDKGEFEGGLIADLQTRNKCIELARILSRLRLLITSVEYEAAEKLILSSLNKFTTMNEIVTDDISNRVVNNLTEYFAEIQSLFSFLKSIQGHPTKDDKNMIFKTNLLPIDLKMTALNNLRNKERFEHIISELKYGVSSNDLNKRTILIEEAHIFIRKNFARGTGSNLLKKWAMQQLYSINIHS